MKWIIWIESFNIYFIKNVSLTSPLNALLIWGYNALSELYIQMTNKDRLVGDVFGGKAHVVICLRLNLLHSIAQSHSQPPQANTQVSTMCFISHTKRMSILCVLWHAFRLKCELAMWGCFSLPRSRAAARTPQPITIWAQNSSRLTRPLTGCICLHALQSYNHNLSSIWQPSGHFKPIKLALM